MAQTERVSLLRDCDCGPATHGDMPHWVHLDRKWQEENQTLLESARIAQDENGCFAFLRQETARQRAMVVALQQNGLLSIEQDDQGVWIGTRRIRNIRILTGLSKSISA